MSNVAGKLKCNVVGDKFKRCNKMQQFEEWTQKKISSSYVSLVIISRNVNRNVNPRYIFARPVDMSLRMLLLADVRVVGVRCMLLNTQVYA